MMAISYASDLMGSKAAWEWRLSEPLREIAAAQAIEDNTPGLDGEVPSSGGS